MLVADDLSYRYSRRSPWVLHGHSLQLRPGRVLGLQGPSGSGKSTLAAVAAGLRTPASGTVTVDGRPLASYAGPSPVQLVLQHPERAMNPRWRIRDVLAEALPGSRREAAAQVSARVEAEWDAHHGLVSPTWLDRYPHEVSGGELQRVNLARALLTGPKYLVADEISASLDAITQTVLWHRLDHEVAETGLGVLAVSHDRALLEQVADEVLDFATLGDVIRSAPQKAPTV
ncbi:ABC transporter ATP-binding protein [Nocardioides jishulii]|uniref:ATP-binding cassette domain-containing protein n=1 Tax=Nocardioides jishulii TaxID=2575440 RepID=A0A4U2YSN9_9ACTN|nr:ATP-binding cassette domain-containing protein [Nocardioides jishulii]QCX26551.1 ATP-binding cassette domain-containing protein [Nocardioides jishulii]TKI63642.1 ATP-binding cassette domain-containing protein [Nocardioides jishulii]